MKKNKLYPITILEKQNTFIATIAELGISVKDKTYEEALKKCIFEQEKTIKILNEKKVPLPNILNNTNFKLLSGTTFKKITLFISKSVASAIILIITFAIIAILISPKLESYLDSPYTKDYFSKFSKKLGISFCIKEECAELND